MSRGINITKLPEGPKETRKTNELINNDAFRNLGKLPKDKVRNNFLKGLGKKPVQMGRGNHSNEENKGVPVDMAKVKNNLIRNQESGGQDKLPTLSSLTPNNDGKTFTDPNGNMYARVGDSLNTFYSLNKNEVVTLWN